jgi:hypothetical protein
MDRHIPVSLSHHFCRIPQSGVVPRELRDGESDETNAKKPRLTRVGRGWLCLRG